MRNNWSLEYADRLEFSMVTPKVIKQSRAAAKEHGYKLNLNIVEKTDFKILLTNVRATHHRNILVTSSGFCLLEGSLKPSRHESVNTVLGTLFGRVMRHHEHWSPRCSRRTIRAPAWQGSVVSGSAADHRAQIADGIRKELTVDFILIAHCPFVQNLTAITHWRFHARI